MEINDLGHETTGYVRQRSDNRLQAFRDDGWDTASSLALSQDGILRFKIHTHTSYYKIYYILLIFDWECDTLNNYKIHSSKSLNAKLFNERFHFIFPFI